MCKTKWGTKLNQAERKEMTYIAANFDDVQEQGPAPIGQYELQITGCTLTETGENSKHPGAPMYKCTLGFTDLELNAPVITHYITLPYEGDENASFKLLMLKRFLHHFNVPEKSYKDGFDAETLAMELVGQAAVTDVGLTEPRPDTGATFNNIRIPRIPSENAAGKGKPPARRRA